MRTAEWDSWIERARAVRIEDEATKRGIKLNGKAGKNEHCGECPKCGGVHRFSINTKKGVFHCRGCGKGGDVIDLTMFLDGTDFVHACETLTGEPPPKANGKERADGARKVVAGTYPYHDAAGEVALVVERFEYQNPDGSFVMKDGKRKKTFRQKRPDPDRPGGWIWSAEGVPPLIYLLPEVTEEIAAEHTILIVEGERKADLLWEWGVPATCCPGGAERWKAEHSEFLRGADVVILPDNDLPGRKHVDAVARSLAGIARSLRILELPDLPPKGDIVDWAEAGHTRKQLDALIEWAPDYHPAADSTPDDYSQTAGDKPREQAAGSKSDDDMNGGGRAQNTEQQHRLGDHPSETKDTELQQPSKPLLHAYVPRPFSQIPRRQWLHAGHYIRQQVVMTVAPGGYGKTTLIIANVIEMCIGKGLLGPAPPGGALRVAYWNGEDPEDEVERRIAAACLHHNIDPEVLRGRLFLGSKITGRRRLASLDKTGNVVFDDGILAEITQFITDNKIDCAMFDPLIAFHRVPEGNNNAMEEVIKQAFEPIALSCNCCVELSQHTRKSAASQQGEIGVDDSRGAGAITNAARSVRVLNRMTVQEAELPKIEPEERRHYLRVNRDKTNLAPPGKATWIHLASVEIPNGDGNRPGDHVQAAEPWDYPQPFDGVTAHDMHWMRETVRTGDYRREPRSPEWVGRPLLEHLKLDTDNKGDRKKVSAILKTWFDNSVLATEERKDDKRRPKQFVIPGSWNEEEQ